MHRSSSQKDRSQHLFALEPDLWKLGIFCSKENSLSYSLCFSINISLNVNIDFYGDGEGHDEKVALDRSEEMPQGAHCSHCFVGQEQERRGLSQKCPFLPETVAS